MSNSLQKSGHQTLFDSNNTTRPLLLTHTLTLMPNRIYKNRPTFFRLISDIPTQTHSQVSFVLPRRRDASSDRKQRKACSCIRCQSPFGGTSDLLGAFGSYQSCALHSRPPTGTSIKALIEPF